MTLTIPVSAPGLASTTAGFAGMDRAAARAAGSAVRARDSIRGAGAAAATSGAQAGRAAAGWGTLATRMRSGEFVRNAATSFALLSQNGGDATDKILALSASLTSVPGKVGAVATAATIGVALWQQYAQAAKRAAEEVAALGAATLKAEGEFGAGLDKIADRIASSAREVGAELRSFATAGGSPAERRRLQGLMPGDARGALAGASQLAESGLSDGAREQVLSVLERARTIGTEITGDIVARAIEAAKGLDAGDPAAVARARDARDAAAERGGGIFGARSIPIPEAPSERAQVAALVAGPDASTEALDRVFRRLDRAGDSLARGIEASLALAERGSVRAAGDRIREAGEGGTRGFGPEALMRSTEEQRGSMDALTREVIELRKVMEGAQRAQITKRNETRDRGGWGFRSPWTIQGVGASQ